MVKARKWWTIGFAAVIVVVLAVTATLGVLFARARSVENARGSSLAAAQLYVQKMYSFSPETISENITFMMAHLTGAAKKEYESNVVEHRIAEQTKEQKVVATVTDQGSGVIENTRDTARVLLFINQSATAGASGDIDVTPARVVYGMERRGGTWLINDVQLINDETLRDMVDDGAATEGPRESIPVAPPATTGGATGEPAVPTG